MYLANSGGIAYVVGVAISRRGLSTFEGEAGMPVKNFGRHLKQIRQEKGLTQVNLARMTQLSDRHIRNLEKGERWPEATTVRKLCKALSVTLRELFDFDYP